MSIRYGRSTFSPASRNSASVLPSVRTTTGALPPPPTPVPTAACGRSAPGGACQVPPAVPATASTTSAPGKANITARSAHRGSQPSSSSISHERPPVPIPNTNAVSSAEDPSILSHPSAPSDPRSSSPRLTSAKSRRSHSSSRRRLRGSMSLPEPRNSAALSSQPDARGRDNRALRHSRTSASATPSKSSRAATACQEAQNSATSSSWSSRIRELWVMRYRTRNSRPVRRMTVCMSSRNTASSSSPGVPVNRSTSTGPTRRTA